MIPVTNMGVEIFVNGGDPYFQSYFPLRGEDGFLNETRNIGYKSQSYVGMVTVDENVYDLSCMINYFEDHAGAIGASMTVDYFECLSFTSYTEDEEEYDVIVTSDVKPLPCKDVSRDIYWNLIKQVSSPKSVKHEMCFGEYCLEVYDPFCLEEINIYRKYDYSSLEFVWIWKKHIIPHDEYELRMRLYAES